MPRRRSQSCLAVAGTISRPLSRRSRRTKSFPRPWYLNAVSRSPPGCIGLALIQQTAHGRAIASALFGVRFAGLRRPGLGPSKELGLEGGELRRRPLVNLLHLQGGAGQRAAEGGELGVLGGKPAVKYLQLALPVRHGGGQLRLAILRSVRQVPERLAFRLQSAFLHRGALFLAAKPLELFGGNCRCGFRIGRRLPRLLRVLLEAARARPLVCELARKHAQLGNCARELGYPALGVRQGLGRKLNPSRFEQRAGLLSGDDYKVRGLARGGERAVHAQPFALL